MYDTNPSSKTLFSQIAKKLSFMGLLNSEDFLNDDLIAVRSTYKKTFKELILSALNDNSVAINRTAADR
jgi:hypothetical protein